MSFSLCFLVRCVLSWLSLVGASCARRLRFFDPLPYFPCVRALFASLGSVRQASPLVRNRAGRAGDGYDESCARCPGEQACGMSALFLQSVDAKNLHRTDATSKALCLRGERRQHVPLVFYLALVLCFSLFPLTRCACAAGCQ